MKNFFKQRNSCLYILIFVFFLTSCANIVTPTGGPKDTTPPVVISSSPPNKTISFTGYLIKINFNEFIRLNDINNQFIISPLLEYPPQVKERGKSVLIQFKDKLDVNTTYTLYFGNAIADITEGNILNNYQFVFSTGPILDSMSVVGTLVNAFDNKAESSALIMLYDKNIDSLPVKSKLQYITKSSANGLFELNNLKADSFKIFALKDANSDYMFNQPNEKIAFLNELVISEKKIDTKKDSITKNINHSLFMFEEADTVQRLAKYYLQQTGKLLLVFKQAVKNLKIKSLRNQLLDDWKKEEYNITKDSLICWFALNNIDSLILEVSDNDKVLDTIEIPINEKLKQKNSGKGRGDNDKLSIFSNAHENSLFDINTPLIINCSNPIATFDFTKVILKEKKDTIKPHIIFKNNIQRTILISHKWKEGTAYSLFVPPTTLTDMFGYANDTLQINFKTKTLRDYGSITLKLDLPTNINSFIIQLKDENDKLISEQFVKSSQTIKFEYLIPKNYKIKMLFDDNNNQRWDTGKYLKKQQPEKVFYYSESVTVKPNWDLYLEWKPIK